MQPSRAWLALGLIAFVSGLSACARDGGGERPRHLLVLSADSLRADRLELWSGEGVETPALARLAEGGTLFENVWAVTPWTAPSMVSLFTGLYPPSHGVVLRDDTTPAELPTLPRLAAAAGMRLGNFAFFSGVSYFRNLGLGPPLPGLAHGREADAFAGWLAQLEAEGEGELPAFFAWIHLLEPHLPYGSSGYRPEKVQVHGSSGLERAQLRATVPVGSVEFEPGDRERLLALYDEDIVRLDVQVGRILASLEEHSALADTVVVFVADHGEELLERGWVGHASTAIQAKLIPETLRIPLLIAGPGMVPGRDPRLVQHVDVLPTLAALFGFGLSTPTDGKDLRRESGVFSRPREVAFFDSSLGGNLTPVERRVERLQGVSDGECLVTVHSGVASERWGSQELGPSGCAWESRLRDELAEWRAAQGSQRLAILERHAGAGQPPHDGDAFDQGIEIVSPPAQARLRHAQVAGLFAFEWRGSQADEFWVEYRGGEGILAVEGAFRVESPRLQFGPFPAGFWNDVARYSPFRFRILDARGRRRSEWHSFQVLPAEGSSAEGS